MEEDLMKLSKEQIKQILKKGYTFVLLPNNRLQRITKEDLCFKKDEIEKYLEEKKLKLGRKDEMQ